MAFDKSEPKVAKLTANCHRLGITCVYSFVYDSIKALDPEKQYNKKSCKYKASFKLILWCMYIMSLINRIQFLCSVFCFYSRRLFMTGKFDPHNL